jgi:hypothetical protein
LAHARRWLKRSATWLAATFLIASGACVQEKGHRFVLPDGYIGNVRVDFLVPGAPPLSEEDGFHLVVVPESGVVSTSSDMRTSPKRDEVFFQRGDVRVRAPYSVRGNTYTPKEPGAVIKWWIFFGPEDAILSEAADRKVNGEYVPGRLPGTYPARSPDRE